MSTQAELDVFWKFIADTKYQDLEYISNLDISSVRRIINTRIVLLKKLYSVIEGNDKLFNMLSIGFTPDNRDPTQPSLFKSDNIDNIDIIEVYSAMVILEGENKYNACVLPTSVYSDFMFHNNITIEYMDKVMFLMAYSVLKKKKKYKREEIFKSIISDQETCVQNIMNIIPFPSSTLGIVKWNNILTHVETTLNNNISEKYKNGLYLRFIKIIEKYVELNKYVCNNSAIICIHHSIKNIV
jgi:hypothetical protein